MALKHVVLTPRPPPVLGSLYGASRSRAKQGFAFVFDLLWLYRAVKRAEHRRKEGEQGAGV